jgi:hypothetical protein
VALVRHLHWSLAFARRPKGLVAEIHRTATSQKVGNASRPAMPDDRPDSPSRLHEFDSAFVVAPYVIAGACRNRQPTASFGRPVHAAF